MRLIDADHLIGLVNDATILGDGFKQAFTAIVNGEPTIEPERKKGEWILVRDADETENALYECPFCHKGECHVPIVEVHYCWNCGAVMEEQE